MLADEDFSVNVQFLFPCFLCLRFKIKLLCSLGCARVCFLGLGFPGQGDASVVQVQHPLAHVSLLPQFKERERIIIIIISPFSPHYASTMSSGSFRAGLHKHTGKNSEKKETFNLLHPYSEFFWGGNMINYP